MNYGNNSLFGYLLLGGVPFCSPKVPICELTQSEASISISSKFDTLPLGSLQKQPCVGIFLIQFVSNYQSHIYYRKILVLNTIIAFKGPSIFSHCS